MSSQIEKDRINFGIMIGHAFVFGLLLWGVYIISSMLTAFFQLPLFDFLEGYSANSQFIMIMAIGIISYLLIAFLVLQKRKR
jgi:uncharacterized membrane protein (DUF4010 family)